LPGLHSDEFVGSCIEHRFDFGSYVSHNCKTVTYAFGQVASTGDYKVLRISHPHLDDLSQPLLCDIITLDGSSQGRWRTKQNPPSNLWREGIMECLAVNTVVHFFFDYGLMEPTSIAPFDLDTEKWMPTLRGPEPLRSAKFGFIYLRAFSLANLNGSLVIVDNDFGNSNFDVWFLLDHKRGLWVKKYSLSVEKIRDDARPLLILDDGRIVFFDIVIDTVKRLLQCYDPTTGNLADVLDFEAIGLAESKSIAVYTGSLLI
jgi:F-box interacting protein